MVSAKTQKNVEQLLKGCRGHSNLWEKGVDEDPFCLLEFFPNNFKTQEMCKKVVKKCTRSLMYVPDCCARRRKMIDIYDRYKLGVVLWESFV